jgi:hypothetical protein
VGDAEVQHQRHRARRVREVGRQLNILTMSSPAFSNVLRLGVMRGTEKVSQLLNRPVVSGLQWPLKLSKKKLKFDTNLNVLM